MIHRILNLPKNNSFFLLGPRQTGKSWLVRNTFSSAETLSYDLLDRRQFTKLKADPGVFAEEVRNRDAAKKYVVIDEVQKIPELLDEVHRLLEAPNAPKFILSGSSARSLRRKDANLLAGRAWKLQLFPLTFEELEESFSLTRVLQFGTLPSIYLAESGTFAANSLRAYVELYLQEEIQAESVTRNLAAFLKFLPLAAESSGKQINLSKLGRVVASNYGTIKGYYKVLEDTLIGAFLEPFAGSTRLQLAKHPKFYLFDTGVTRAILGRETAALNPGTYEYGALFESWVINEVWRLNSYNKKNFKTSFFRTDSGAEVDLVIQTPSGQTFGIEIKSADSVTAADLEPGFSALLNTTKLDRQICVYTGMHPNKIGDIDLMPFADFFSWLKGV